MVYKRSKQSSRKPNKRVTRHRRAPIKRIQRVAPLQPKQKPETAEMIESPATYQRVSTKPTKPPSRWAKHILGGATVVVAVALICTIAYTAFQFGPSLIQASSEEVSALPTPIVNAIISMPEIVPTATLVPAIEADSFDSPREEVEQASTPPANLIDPDLASALPQLGKPRPLDTEPGRLIIPDLDIEEEVLGLDLVNNAWDIQSLGLGIGLLESTGRYPGDDFSMVFAGHVRTRWSFWGPFSQLSTLGNGAEVIYQWDGHNFVYEVTGRRVMEPSEGELLFRHEEGTILLLTCIGYDPATGDYAERLLVEAKLVQEPFKIAE